MSSILSLFAVFLLISGAFVFLAACIFFYWWKWYTGASFSGGGAVDIDEESK